MRLRLIDIFIYLLAAAAGFYLPGVLFYLCAHFNWLPAGKGIAGPFMVKFTLTPLIWIAGLVVGLGGFLLRRRELRYWLLLLPIYLPLFYTALIFVYFNFLPQKS